MVDTNKLCVCQNIPLSDHRDSSKTYPELRQVVLPIQEILQNYYSIKSREGTKTLNSSFRMLHDILFQLRFFFCRISRQTVILVSYSLFMFYSMVGEYK